LQSDLACQHAQQKGEQPLGRVVAASIAQRRLADPQDGSTTDASKRQAGSQQASPGHVSRGGLVTGWIEVTLDAEEDEIALAVLETR